MEIGVLLIEGADGQVERRFILKVGGNSLGRDSSNDVVLDAAGVERFHARVIFTGDECTITDLSEAGGIQINDEVLPPRSERLLRNGDRVRIGAKALRFVRAQSGQRRVVPPDVAAQTPGVRLPLRVPRTMIRPRLLPPAQRSRYLDLLPAIYERTDIDGVLNGLLLICESILNPLDQQIAQLHYYLDPACAPEALLPWLATWVDLALDEHWPIEQRRLLIRQAVDLYRWRGTRRGLRNYVQIYAGIEPIIIEPGQEQRFPLPADTQRVTLDDQLQPRTVALGPSDQRLLGAHHFRIVVGITPGSYVSLDLLQRIIESEKPAHTAYTLYVADRR